MSWRLAYSLEDLQDEVWARWPGTTIWTIGDAAHRSRASDHNPNQQDVVCAVDVVGRAKAGVIWDRLLAGRDRRIKYLIFDGKIVSRTTQPWTVRPYGGSNPHRDHIHVSVGDGPSGKSTGPYDQRGPWGLANDQEDAMTPAQEKKLDELIKRVDQFEKTILSINHNVTAAQKDAEAAKNAASGARTLGHQLKNLDPPSELAQTIAEIRDAVLQAPPGGRVRVIVEGPHEDS